MIRLPTRVELFRFLAVPGFAWIWLASVVTGIELAVKAERPPPVDPPGPDHGCAA